MKARVLVIVFFLVALLAGAFAFLFRIQEVPAKPSMRAVAFFKWGTIERVEIDSDRDGSTDMIQFPFHGVTDVDTIHPEYNVVRIITDINFDGVFDLERQRRGGSCWEIAFDADGDGTFERRIDPEEDRELLREWAGERLMHIGEAEAEFYNEN